jgi:hypothetical protein
MVNGTSIEPGWKRDSFDSPDAWQIPYDDDYSRLTDRVMARLDDNLGFVVIKDVPTDRMSLDGVQDLALRMLAGLGRPVRQGPVRRSRLTWLVRHEGLSRFTPDGRFQEGIHTSKTRDGLELHNDSATRPYGTDFDFFALLAYRSAKSGGESLLVNARTVYSVLRREFPGELARLRQPFAFERRHVTNHGQNPISWDPVFTEAGKRLRVRCNRQRIEMACELTDAPLRSEERAALDALDNILARPELRITFTLQEGECLVVDDHDVLHGRTSFIDHQAQDQRRCLIRVLMTRSAATGQS